VSQLSQIAPSADAHDPVSEAPILPLWQVFVLAALLIWIYLPVLARLAQVWWTNPNFSHGLFVPVFSAYVMWEKRARLAAILRRPSWTGAGLLVLALLVLIVGVTGAELFLSRFSLLLVIAALIVLFFGWRWQRELLFPWAFLALMIPIPSIVFTQITFPLQILASRVASLLLPWLGVPVLREGNVIQLPAMALEVAEACSGIRSLLSLIALAIIYGYLLEKRTWPRVVLALAAVPIAVAANSLRIVGTGLLVQYWNPDKAEGFFHTFSGWLIFVVSLLMLFLLHGTMRRRHPYEEPPE
jgi:exosortase